ncbi:hypothetical protein, partial [Flavobacterium sp.]|uniref:hypothetical protein n=1 Tax=Flavobacterium sp. TaxID=239 RepID=UPI002EDB4C8A
DEYNATILNYIQKLEWENAIISDGVDGEVIEIPFTLKNQLQSSNEKASLNNDRHRLVFIKDDKQKFKIYYVQIFTDNLNAHNLDEDYSYYGMTQNFNGKVFVSDLQTNKTNVIQFKDGQTIQ